MMIKIECILILLILTLFSCANTESKTKRILSSFHSKSLNLNEEFEQYYLTIEDYGNEKFPLSNNLNAELFIKLSQEAARNIPSEPEHFVYRGMVLTPEALEKILETGLDPLLSSIKVLYFAKDAATAISFSRQLPYNQNGIFLNVVFQVYNKIQLKPDGSYLVYEGPEKLSPKFIKAIYLFNKDFKNIEDSFVKLEIN